jgi:GNAT acetyltransferase-like protein
MPEDYDELVHRSPQGSVFAGSWWLDAVAGGRWRTHAVEEGGAVVAAWPTVVHPSPFGDVHGGAPLTPYLGPVFDAEESSLRRRSNEIKHVELLLEKIGRCAHIEARCHPALDYWTPLAWHGFTQTTRYSWRLTDLSDLEGSFRATRENIRREIRKAEKRGLSVEQGELTDFLELHGKTVAHQGLDEAAAANRRSLESIEAAAAPRGARTILLARDAEGRAHAGSYLVHDDRFAYYLVGASDPALRNSGAPSLVMWKGIEAAAMRGVGFDFEGSMVRGVERFFRAFAGTPAPYSVVRKTPSSAFRIARSLKRAARRA